MNTDSPFSVPWQGRELQKLIELLIQKSTYLLLQLFDTILGK